MDRGWRDATRAAAASRRAEVLVTRMRAVAGSSKGQSAAAQTVPSRWPEDLASRHHYACRDREADFVTIRSAEEFIRLRTSEDPAEYNRAASEDADESVWLQLVQEHPELRFWVAQNKAVPLSILRMLVTADDERVRWMVAGKRKLSNDLFELLVSDPDEGVRARLARNAKVPRGVLEKLLHDPSSLVRDAAEAALGS